jgi:hypothetical protein
MALIEKVTGFVGPEGKAALLANENSKFPLAHPLLQYLTTPSTTV